MNYSIWSIVRPYYIGAVFANVYAVDIDFFAVPTPASLEAQSEGSG